MCLILCLVSGCSATQFIYNRVDIVIRWYLDDYVTLSRDQRAQFDERLDDLLAWHRQEELPTYVTLLDDTLVILEEGVPVESARLMAARIEAAANRIQGPFLDLLLSTGQTLDLSQRQGFVEALLVKQDELEADRLARDDEDYRTDIEARFDEQMSDYLGPLSDRQTERIRSGVMEMTRLDTFWLADRRVWITTLSEILIADSPDWPQQVRALIAGRELDYRTPVGWPVGAPPLRWSPACVGSVQAARARPFRSTSACCLLGGCAEFGRIRARQNVTDFAQSR